MMTGVSGWRSLNLRQQLKAALARQRKIEQHQVEGIELEKAQTLLAIVCGAHREPFKRQQHLKRFANARFIIDYQDACVVRDGR